MSVWIDEINNQVSKNNNDMLSQSNRNNKLLSMYLTPSNRWCQWNIKSIHHFLFLIDIVFVYIFSTSHTVGDDCISIAELCTMGCCVQSFSSWIGLDDKFIQTQQNILCIFGDLLRNKNSQRAKWSVYLSHYYGIRGIFLLDFYFLFLIQKKSVICLTDRQQTGSE